MFILKLCTSKKELKEIMYLDRLASKEKTWWKVRSTKNLNNLIKKQQLYLINCDNKDVGFLDFNFPNKDLVILQDVFVLPEFRENGLATLAISESLKLIKKKYKLKRIQLVCSESLKVFYEHLGFKLMSVNMVKEL